MLGDVLLGGAKAFKIDHPLDPDNKYLFHSVVESPDMINVYNGHVDTDAHGQASIELPLYFQALNRDFRYQLTVIGQFAPAIVDTEVENNRFSIRTDKPGVKVSWQLTGIRQDAFANARRVQVEVDKTGDEQGRYLHPELFGQPPEMHIPNKFAADRAVSAMTDDDIEELHAWMDSGGTALRRPRAQNETARDAEQAETVPSAEGAQ